MFRKITFLTQSVFFFVLMVLILISTQRLRKRHKCPKQNGSRKLQRRSPKNRSPRLKVSTYTCMYIFHVHTFYVFIEYSNMIIICFPLFIGIFQLYNYSLHQIVNLILKPYFMTKKRINCNCTSAFVIHYTLCTYITLLSLLQMILMLPRRRQELMQSFTKCKRKLKPMQYVFKSNLRHFEVVAVAGSEDGVQLPGILLVK